MLSRNRGVYVAVKRSVMMLREGQINTSISERQ